MRRWWLLLVGCLAVAVVVPAGWWLTRPGDAAGPPVADAVRAPASATAGPAEAAAVATRDAAPPAARPVRGPVRLRVRSLGLDAAVVPVGVRPDGAMQIPAQVDRVGWYEYGSAPGEQAGTVVLAGHVDARGQGLGAMARLRGVAVGARVDVVRAGGGVLGYRVVARQTIVKSRLPVERLFARDGAPRLVMITCGGPFLPELSSYRDNVVVVAEPVTG